MDQEKAIIDGQYNIGHICTRHQVDQNKGEKIALRWISSKMARNNYTFQDFENESNRFANILSDLEFHAEEKVFLLLPKMPEAYFTYLGALKARLICGVLFNNFGPDAIIDRMTDSKANVLITKKNSLHKLADVWKQVPSLRRIIVIDIEKHESERILSYPALMDKAKTDFSQEITHDITPSVLHYTSGSTGKSKGVQHVHRSILSHMSSFKEVMQPHPDDIYWCTADPAWITGTSYGINAPMSLGLTQVQFGGGFDPEIWGTILEGEQVNIFYTAPTVLRMMMQYDDEIYTQLDLSNLKHIFSVGEPLNPEIYEWGLRVLKKEIFDTWFQTETGSIMIANRPGLKVKPGSMGKPLKAIKPQIKNSENKSLADNQIGNLCLQAGWPSMFINYLNKEEVYQSKFADGYYITNDLAKRDEDGYFWFVGRDDDVINTAGHLVSPFEIESSLLELPEIIDVGVIGAPDDLLWEKVVAFIRLKPGVIFTKKLSLKIRIHVSNRVSPIAAPADIRVVSDIPKNNSGKIMRRILRASYSNQAIDHD